MIRNLNGEEHMMMRTIFRQSKSQSSIYSGTVRSKINSKNGWRGVYSISGAAVETSKYIHYTRIIKTVVVNLFRSSNFIVMLRKNS